MCMYIDILVSIYSNIFFIGNIVIFYHYGFKESFVYIFIFSSSMANEIHLYVKKKIYYIIEMCLEKNMYYHNVNNEIYSVLKKS